MHLSCQQVAEMKKLGVKNCETRKRPFIHLFITVSNLSVWIPPEANHNIWTHVHVVCWEGDLRNTAMALEEAEKERKEANKGLIIQQVTIVCN